MEHIHGGPMAGRTVLVTGATSGIGRATALGLATMGAHVAITGRDRGRTEDAAREISAAGGLIVDVFVADLSSQAEVRRLASEVLDGLPRIDVLVNNVGGYWSTRHVTADGLERTFALNHLAPFLLTNLLLDRLERSAPARVVTVASNAHATGRIDFEDLQCERSYSGGRAYSQSKLANVLFTYRLARRLRESAVTVNALHPGVVRTSFGAEDPARIQRLLIPFLRPVMKSPAQGAATSIHLASALELEQVSGRYFAHRRPTRSSTRSYDQAVAARLWEASADLVGLTATPVGEAAGTGPRSGSLGTVDDPVGVDSTRSEHPVMHNRVLIVDDHAPFRSIARQVLTADGFLVVAEAADGAEAIRACGELRPDLVLLDVQLPDIDGFAVAAVLTTRIDPPAVVLVSSRSRTDYGSRIDDCGARGYIAKAELSGDAVRRLLPLPNRVPPPLGR